MTKSVVAALVAVLAFSAYAEEQQKSEGQSAVKIEDVNGQKNKVSGDIDEDIVNAKMRTDSGSKSKWSLSASMNYQGGSVENAFGQERPNIKGTPDQQLNSNFELGPSVRYRWNKNDSVTVGTLMSMNSPLAPSLGTNPQTGKSPDRMDFLDPNVYYNHAGKIGGLQTIVSVGTWYGTSNESRSIDRLGYYDGQFTLLKTWKNGLSVGTLFEGTYYTYATNPGSNLAGASNSYGHDSRQEWELAIYPYVEYQMTDRYFLRTIFGYFNWEHLYGDPEKARMLQEFVYQSVGVGIVINRDFYLYPNIQFMPGDLNSKLTNVALSANMNVF